MPVGPRTRLTISASIWTCCCTLQRDAAAKSNLELPLAVKIAIGCKACITFLPRLPSAIQVQARALPEVQDPSRCAPRLFQHCSMSAAKILAAVLQRFPS